VARNPLLDKRKDPPENKSIQNHSAYPYAKVLVIDPSPNRLVLEAAVNDVSRLLVEPAALGGRGAAVEVFRMLNLDMIPPDDRAFSSLRESALDAALACGSWRWPVSMQACGKMPVLPLEFVPDQHQWFESTPISLRLVNLWPNLLGSQVNWNVPQRALTGDIANNLALLKLQPLDLVLAIFVLDGELPPCPSADETCSIVFDHACWWRI
jgi:hypothetical protein